MSIHNKSLALLLLIWPTSQTIAGEMEISATLSSVESSAPIDAPSFNLTSGFNINLNYNNTPTASQAAAFSAAKMVWESHLVGYLDTVSNNNITIDVNLTSIDGVGGTLGSAGPTAVKFGLENNFIYAVSGEMTFDTADTDNLETAGTFGDVVAHEMGHVLGLGTLWSSSAVGFSGYQELYIDDSGEYTGSSALAQWQTEFGQTNATFVPVELAGGPGTANGHWDEVDGGGGLTGITQSGTGKDLRDEIMTGWLGGSTYISNMTIAQFEDIGYQVVLNGSPVPEPSTYILCALGLPLLLSRRHR